MTTDESGSERTSRTDEIAVRCGLPRTVIDRWIRCGLLDPACGGAEGVSFRAIGRARALAQLWRAGWNVTRIERALALAATVVEDVDEALAGLEASLGCGRVTVRMPDGRLVEPSGQQVFDFATEAAGEERADPGREVRVMRSPRDWFRIAVEAEAVGRLEEAVRAYGHALGPDNPEAHFNLGNCHYALRRRREALVHFESAVAAAPEHAEAWNNLGIVRGEIGDRDGAIAALRRALRLVPHYADAHYNLAEVLAITGDLEGARRHWRAYLAFDPNSRWADRVRRYLLTTGG